MHTFPYLRGNETANKCENITIELTRHISKRMKMIADAIGIGRVSISTYCSRHLFATVLKRNGANIAYISENIGHSDLKSTELTLATSRRMSV